MAFDVAADAYGAFMGRFAVPLAAEFAALLDLTPPMRALDVGCGPGTLTTVLVDRLGPGAVAAVDPSTSFVAAAAARLPGVDVRAAVAASLPFPADGFDVTCAQLVVHFLPDPVAGLAEMARVTKAGGLVAVCVWDHAGGRGPVSTFWRGVHAFDPTVRDESDLPGAREGHLAELCRAAGLDVVVDTALTVRTAYADVDEWWHPYTLGVGPAGDVVAALPPADRTRLRDCCAALLPDGPFTLDATAWTVVAWVPA